VKKRQTQNRKLRKLPQPAWSELAIEKKPSVVTNKSTQEFSERELELLNKGLKYRPKPKQSPVNEVITAVETSIKTLTFEKKACVQESIEKVLTSLNPHQRKKEEKEEWQIVEQLKNKGCVYLEPDKGKGVVILDKSAYHQAALDHLNTPAFEEVKTRRQFPVDTLQGEIKEGLKQLVTEGLLSRREALSLTVDNPVIPSFSCLPKTHKPGNKVRPVVSSQHSNFKYLHIPGKEIQGF
jgi:hypothetical protein